MSRPFQPIAADQLSLVLAAAIGEAEQPGNGVRVAVDGPACAGPVELASSLVDPLRERGRTVEVIDARYFWRDAALRLEHGREDPDSLPDWLDSESLRREVLDPLGPGGSGSFLPSLRDPDTNRSTRAARRPAARGEVVVVAGEFLLGHHLPFDLSIHIALSAGALARRTPASLAWTLPAHQRYHDTIRPRTVADIVIRFDDPEHPAVVDPPGTG